MPPTPDDEAKRLSEEFLILAAHAASATKADDQAMFYQATLGLNLYGICTSKLMPYATTREPTPRPSREALLDAKARSECWKVHWIKRWDVKPASAPVNWRRSSRHWCTAIRWACGLRWPKKLDGHDVGKCRSGNDERHWRTQIDVQVASLAK